MFDWTNFWSSSASNVVTGVFGVVIVFVWTVGKDLRIGCMIRKAITRRTVYMEMDFLGVHIRNTTPWEIVIRKVEFIIAHPSSGTSVIVCQYRGARKPEYDHHILLKPETEDPWAASKSHLRGKIIGGMAIIEYQSLFGLTKVKTVRFSPAHVEMMARTQEKQNYFAAE